MTTRSVLSSQMILPHISKHPTSQYCLEGSEVELSCETNMRPESAEFSWFFNNKLLKNNHNVHIAGSKLIIRNFNADDFQGNFYCVVNTPQGKIRSHHAKLKLPFLHDIFQNKRISNKVSLLELNVLVGSLVILTCPRPKSSPESVPIWYSPNGIIRNSEKYRITNNLYIIDAEPYDTGIYQCGAQNSFTKQMINDTQRVFLRIVKDTDKDITSSKSILKPPPAFRVVVGSNLTLECGVSTTDGKPYLIFWEKFGSFLPDKRTSFDNKTGILQIWNLTKDDRGTYICKIMSDWRSPPIMYKSLIEVEESAHINGNLLNEGIEVSFGSNVDLSCPAVGKPNPVITWFFNGKSLNKSSSFVISGQTLSIVPVTHREEGIYQCFAENIHGIASKTFLISLQPNLQEEDSKVEEINRLVSSRKNGPPVIIAGPANSTALEGDTLVLSCVVEGDGYLFIRWLHNGQQLSNSQTGPGRLDSTGATGSLRIYGAQTSDSGIYTCVVNSGTSSVESSGYVEIVTQKDASHSSVKRLQKDRADSTSFSIKDDKMKFHPPRPYSASSLHSEDVEVSLTDITDLGVEEGIALKWDVLSGSDNIDYFKVLYSGGTGGHSNGYFALDESLSSDVRSYIVDSLVPASSYSFKVEAVSKSAQRFPSNEMEFTRNKRRLPSADDRKLKLATPVIMELWEHPNEGKYLTVGLKWKIKSNQPIEGFSIQYNINDDNSVGGNVVEIKVPVSQSKTSNNGRVFTHLIKLLNHAKEYEFRVFAYYKHHMSLPSNAVSIFKSGDGVESVVRIHDVSQNLFPESIIDSNHLISSQSNIGTIGNQTMLLYTSLAIAIVSLLLLLFTATLVFMLRHYRRRQRFKNIRRCGESLSSFESKRCMTKNGYTLNGTACYCDNISPGNNTLSKLFSFNRHPEAKLHEEDHHNLRSNEGSDCGIYINRCSGCRLMMDSLSRSENITQRNLLNHLQPNGDCNVHPLNSLSTQNAHQQGENFYHTLAETSIQNGESTAPLICQCCGNSTNAEESFAFQRNRTCCIGRHCCICTHRPITAATLRSHAHTSSSSGIGSGGSGGRIQEMTGISKLPKECIEASTPLLDCPLEDDKK